MTTIALIAAVADNGVIGKDGTMAWHLPEDLKFFKQTTLGKPVIMGRVTYDGIGRPLPGRPNIIISRDPSYAPANADKGEVHVARSVDAALALAAQRLGDAHEIMVIGGSSIYAQAFDRAQRFYLTEVHASIEGDASFPPWDRTRWVERKRDRHLAKDGRPAFSFVTLERRA